MRVFIMYGIRSVARNMRGRTHTLQPFFGFHRFRLVRIFVPRRCSDQSTFRSDARLPCSWNSLHAVQPRTTRVLNHPGIKPIRSRGSKKNCGQQFARRTRPSLSTANSSRNALTQPTPVKPIHLNLYRPRIGAERSSRFLPNDLQSGVKIIIMISGINQFHGGAA